MSDTAAHSFWVFWIFNNALLLTIIFSFIVERWLKPQRPRLNIKTVILQSLIVSLLFLAVTLVVQRPIFAALAVSIFLIILTGVSNAKFIALKEPMVFSDITMFSQAFKHPRLYFPFLGLAPVILMPVLIVGLIYAVLTLEPALEITRVRILMTLTTIVFSFLGAISIAQNLKLNQDPAIDNQDHGLLNSLLAYVIQARSSEHQNYIKNVLSESPFVNTSNNLNNENITLNKTPPHFPGVSSKQSFDNITVIQSESFFDARRLDESIKGSVLENYDTCISKSLQFGKLNVPAWGANTMRTEFSFLTGLKYENMGLYRYYPYQYLHKMQIVSLAKLLQSQGYHCVCIHPHPASFFGRDRIFPKMGFDEFIDIKSFDQKDTFGPYISDQAVTNKILEINNKYKDKPVFIFAITMENHGPLHLEKTTKDEQNQYYSKAPIDEVNDLTVYLRHLKNADKMVQELTSEYEKQEESMTLCFYGDHIPSMPKIYQQLAYEDRNSDYFIWNNKTVKQSAKQLDISVDGLAETLLMQTGNIEL
ncbi:MAG: phosphoglycerol transferase MdoB-like AlkP superfamily enzyme [Cocleimonas sp.]|jgi:phosphoglycerol transferase MdoB-like AlkP superfamily enzyme